MKLGNALKVSQLEIPLGEMFCSLMLETVNYFLLVSNQSVPFVFDCQEAQF